MDNPKYRPNDKTFLARIRPFISNILIRDGMMDVKSEMIARMTGMLKEENILQSVKLGLWTLELDTVNGKNRLYVDKSMRSILGIDDIMNSEDISGSGMITSVMVITIMYRMHYMILSQPERLSRWNIPGIIRNVEK